LNQLRIVSIGAVIPFLLDIGTATRTGMTDCLACELCTKA
jgi:hypothetical protein